MMIVLAATHIPAAMTIALALGVFAWVAWYWRRLGCRGVPASRRRIRRLSMALVLASLPVLVAGLSFIDPDASGPERARYINVWLLAMTLVGLVVITAMLDVINNLRIISHQEEEAAAEAAAELIDALAEAKKKKPPSPQPSPTPGRGGGKIT